MSSVLDMGAERVAFEAAAATLNIPPTSMAGFELWLAARNQQGALTDALPEHEVICMAVKIGQTYPSINAATSESLILFARAIEARNTKLEQECRSLSALVGDLNIQLANIEARNQQGTLTDAQIAAGAAILCDHGTPIGRNAAISVYDAMGGSQQGDAGWISVDESMPASGQRVIFGWVNSLGNWRTSMGNWNARFTEEARSIDEDACEYKEADDNYYLLEGWNEWGWELEFSAYVSDPVTHWMSIPAPPAIEQRKAEKKGGA